jgi:hypothetical protein
VALHGAARGVVITCGVCGCGRGCSSWPGREGVRAPGEQQPGHAVMMGCLVSGVWLLPRTPYLHDDLVPHVPGRQASASAFAGRPSPGACVLVAATYSRYAHAGTLDAARCTLHPPRLPAIDRSHTHDMLMRCGAVCNSTATRPLLHRRRAHRGAAAPSRCMETGPFRGGTVADLTAWLARLGVEVSAYGRGTAKSLEDLLEEVGDLRDDPGRTRDGPAPPLHSPSRSALGQACESERAPCCACCRRRRCSRARASCRSGKAGLCAWCACST